MVLRGARLGKRGLRVSDASTRGPIPLDALRRPVERGARSALAVALAWGGTRWPGAGSSATMPITTRDTG
jgi:hypothetical protein